MVAVLGTSIAAVALSGPACAFHGLSWIWSAALLVCVTLSLICLALTHTLDPGVLTPRPFLDPIIPIIESLVLETSATNVELNGHTYTRNRQGVWLRFVPGAV